MIENYKFSVCSDKSIIFIMVYDSKGEPKGCWTIRTNQKNVYSMLRKTFPNWG